jgi:hypothetical protein
MKDPADMTDNEFADAIGKALDDNDEYADVLKNEGRVAFASGMLRDAPEALTEAGKIYWRQGYDAAAAAHVPAKRKKPAERVRRAEKFQSLPGMGKSVTALGTEGEHSGGSVSYYVVEIAHPTHQPAPYTVECNDIIEALEMDYAEGNVFKAIWRTAAARQGKMKKGHDAKYDAEKIVFFGQRLLERALRYLKG